MDNQSLLQTLGLTDKESQIYNLLLTLGKVQASTLISKTGLKRATVYKSLYTLESKGLIKQEDIKKKKHFTPLSPNNLIKLSDEQFQKQERAREDLRSILPTLTSNYILSVERPVITTFEGVQGLKKIYEDTLKDKKTIDAVVQKGEVNPELLKWLDTYYIKNRLKFGIEARVLVSGSGEEKEKYIEDSKEQLRKIKEVDHTKFPFYHEIDIYGDKVAFINYKKGENLIGVLIHHPLIAATLRSMFELAWLGASSS